MKHAPRLFAGGGDLVLHESLLAEGSAAHDAVEQCRYCRQIRHEISMSFSDMKKKLLLLGGSSYLLPVIEKAHALGLYVITCGCLPHNAAHPFSFARRGEIMV